MPDALDVFAMFGNQEYLWIGCVYSKDHALELINKRGPEVAAERFLVRSQLTGNRTFYKTAHNNAIVQLEDAAD